MREVTHQLIHTHMQHDQIVHPLHCIFKGKYIEKNIIFESLSYQPVCILPQPHPLQQWSALHFEMTVQK